MSDILLNKYVKFMRGTQEAYDALAKKDENTLYFVYDPANEKVGALYMGDRVISGGDIVLASATLKELADVLVESTKENSFLVQNANGKWDNVSVEDVAALIQAHMSTAAAPAQVFQADQAENETPEVAIARVVGNKELIVGDIAIVKTLIADDKYQHTAYVYNGSAWAAMDGNYNADNVYFDNDLVLTYTFGRFAPDSSGRVTVPAKGLNLQALLENAYSLETKTGLKTADPTASVNGSIKYYEIGSTGTQDITVSLNSDGEYKYGYSTSPATGNEGDASITVKNDKSTGVVVDTSADAPYQLTFNSTAVSPKAAKGNVFTLAPAAQKEKTEMSIVGTVHHTAGGIPVSNLGKLYPAQKIAAGSKSTSAAARARWYIPMYYGFTYSDNVITNPASISAADVAKLSKITGESAYNATKKTTDTATKAWRQYFLAVPADYGWEMSGAKDGNNIDCTVRQAADVTMSFGSGDSAVDVIYNVFYINNAADYGTLKITWNLG